MKVTFSNIQINTDHQLINGYFSTDPRFFRFVFAIYDNNIQSIGSWSANTIFYNTVCHELGHSAFGLYHPWDQFAGYNNSRKTLGQDPDNFMDYQNGFKSRKYQWDWIHGRNNNLYNDKILNRR